MWVELEQDYKISEIIKLEDKISLLERELAESAHHNKYMKADLDHKNKVYHHIAREEHFSSRLYTLNE